MINSENSDRKHLSTFLLTPHKRDVPKLVLHLLNHAKVILLHLVKLVIAF